MGDWRIRVLEPFQAPFAHLYLVSDPDCLLQDEAIVSRMLEQGLELLDFQDRAQFRFLYESEYRTRLEKRRLVIRVASESLAHLPYDLLSQGKAVYLRKSELFPTLSAPLVRQLDTAVLDVLSRLDHNQGGNSHLETARFLLTRVYKLPYDELDGEGDLWALLIQKHQLKLPLPQMLEEMLLQFISRHKGQYPAFPLKKMFYSRQDFYAFLQQEWANFVQGGFPADHPFWHERLRTQIMMLFLEGKLSSVEVKKPYNSHPFAFGMRYDPTKEKAERLEQILSRLEQIAAESLDRRGWIEVTSLYGRAKNLSLQLETVEHLNEKLHQLERDLEQRFEAWLLQHYGALASLTDAHVPVMLHKVAEYVHLHGGEKKAVIVIDGMSYIQWAQIADELRTAFALLENGTFAWIPTVTPVSRQAIFSGMIPKDYADSIHTTAKEEKLWRECWQKYGIGGAFVSYEKALGQGAYNPGAIQALAKEKIKVAGIVIDVLDRILHSSLQGYAGIYEALRLWLKSGFLQSLLQDLLDAGFSVYLTSDHGNKESRGIGRLYEGSLVESQGERVRIYRYKKLKELAAEQIPAYQWQPIGLPDDYYPLLARGDTAFAKKGELVVSHGGASFEEVIVPFVQVLPRQARKEIQE
ncbi:BREX-3 system phosphatase PglZ [Bacillaceae bacterium]